MGWVVAIAAVLGGAVAPAVPPKPVEVMVIGTYHFDNPGQDLNNPRVDDVLKPRRQHELKALSAALASFRPTKIMVERVAKTPDLVDPRYAEFRPSDLGRNRDERVQIAYRLAQRLGQRRSTRSTSSPKARNPIISRSVGSPTGPRRMAPRRSSMRCWPRAQRCRRASRNCRRAIASAARWPC